VPDRTLEEIVARLPKTALVDAVTTALDDTDRLRTELLVAAVRAGKLPARRALDDAGEVHLSEHAARHHGPLVRESSDWADRLGEVLDAALAVAGGPRQRFDAARQVVETVLDRISELDDSYGSAGMLVRQAAGAAVAAAVDLDQAGTLDVEELAETLDGWYCDYGLTSNLEADGVYAPLEAIGVQLPSW